MIQILGIRQHAKSGKKTDAFFEKNWRAPSVAEVLKSPEKWLKSVPKEERYNLYYTVAICTERKRELARQEVMPFDIDPPKGEVLSGDLEPHIQVFCSTLGVDRAKTGIVFSGGGLQFLIGLATPFEHESFFEQYRDHYRQVCVKLTAALEKAGLKGSADPSVFSPARLFRMPNTENRKPGREPALARVLQGVIAPVEFSLSEVSGIPLVKKKDALVGYGDTNRKDKFPEPDVEGVLKGCSFLKNCKDNPNAISELQWYAALSITARLPNGNQISHELSQGYSGYTHTETENKIDQALKASGPRTCANINAIWGGCIACPHFEKIASPILIEGPNHVKTAKTGFHNVYVTKDGTVKIGKPDYVGLLKHFDKEHRHCVLDSSGIVYVWAETHYKMLEDLRIKAFAQEHFDPPANNKMVSEFKELVTRKNIKSVDFFTHTLNGRMNFQNGIYTRATGELVPHSPDVGFRYCLPYAYDPEAKATLFEKFLGDVTGSNEALANILLEFMGYAFSNDPCWLGKVLILTGEGANGKSTFLNVMKEVAGKDNYSALNMGEIKSETNRQLMDGKLFNLAEETPKNALVESAHFKNIVTGGEMQVRALYKQPYSIINKTKLIFAANALPRSEDTTKAFFRRLAIVPFNQVFEKEKRDPHIFEKLKAELPGIFNLVMRGYDRLLKQKDLSASTISDEAIERYREEICTVTRWFREGVQVYPLKRKRMMGKADLYQAYALETENNGDEPDNAMLFGKKMARLVPDYQERISTARIQGKPAMVIWDIGLGVEAQADF